MTNNGENRVAVEGFKHFVGARNVNLWYFVDFAQFLVVDCNANTARFHWFEHGDVEC